MSKNKKPHDLDLKVNINIKAIDNITGKVKDEVDIHNLVVTTGKSRIAQLINGVSTNFFEYIGIGTGTTSPVVGDTDLEAETTRALATTDESVSGTARWVKVFTFSSGESYAITETGIFDGSASGATLMNRSTFSAINVDVDTDLSITITIAVDNCP